MDNTMDTAGRNATGNAVGIRSAVGDLIKEVRKEIVKDFCDLHGEGYAYFLKVLKAYNCHHKSEGVNDSCIIRSIDDQDDLSECVRRGMAASDISELYKASLTNTQYFVIDGSGKPSVFRDMTAVCAKMLDTLDEVILSVLTDPWYGQYREVYMDYVVRSVYSHRWDEPPADEKDVTVTSRDIVREIVRD